MYTYDYSFIYLFICLFVCLFVDIPLFWKCVKNSFFPEEDEEFKLETSSSCGSQAAIDSMNQILQSKLEELRKCNALIGKIILLFL